MTATSSTAKMSPSSQSSRGPVTRAAALTGSQAEGHILQNRHPVMSNQVIERKPNGQFAKGVSGNLGGNAQRSRHALNADTIRAMHEAFRDGGRAAIMKVMKTQPAVFLKLLVLLVPRELQVEHKGGVKGMTDEQLEQGIEAIQAMLAARDAGENAKVIEALPEIAALPAPPRKAKRKVRRSDQVVGPSMGTDGTASQAENANVIQGTADPATLPASTALDQSQRKSPR
jgi:hypothetical protein